MPEKVYETERDVHFLVLRTAMTNWFEEYRLNPILLLATMVAATSFADDQHVWIGDTDTLFANLVGQNLVPESTAVLPGLVLSVGFVNGLAVEMGPAGSDQ